jgi:hypothetical protein
VSRWWTLAKFTDAARTSDADLGRLTVSAIVLAVVIRPVRLAKVAALQEEAAGEPLPDGTVIAGGWSETEERLTKADRWTAHADDQAPGGRSVRRSTRCSGRR